MTTRRTSGPQGHAAKSALTQPAETTLPLYLEIVGGLPLGVVILRLENPQDARSFRIIDLNPVAALITGSTLEDLRGRTLAEFPKLLKTAIPGRCLDAFQAREPRNLGEISYGDARIRQGIYSVQVFPLSGGFMGVAFENVTDRKHAENALRESEQRFRLLIQGIQEYALFQLDPRGRVVSWNAGAERLKGYRAEEIIGKHFSLFYPREDVIRGTPEQNLEEAAQRGQSVHEEERTSIAREIHDELGQACTAIKMDLALIGRKTTKRQTRLRAKADSASRLVDDMIVTLRRIASELRPRTLDDLGLAAALESQAQEFEARTGIHCRVALPEEPLTLDDERSTAIFRIFQESLTNVARHAHATRVEARLERKADQLIFQVRDNGRGFDPEIGRASC